MTTVEQLRTAGRLQQRLCAANGSATYAAFIDSMLSDLDIGGPAADLLRTDDREPIRSALFLRVLGAVHRVALNDPQCTLRSFLPSTGGTVDVKASVEAFREVIAQHTDTIARDMTVNIQTNEVGRSAPLSAAMNYIAGTSGRPLRLLEVGASAGLNLLPDRFFVDAGASSWGPSDSPVQLIGHFASGSPPAGELEVVARLGCDLNPLDPTSPASRQLLRSFIWPEHVERLRRLDAACRVAQAQMQPVAVHRRDALSWTGEHLGELPTGTTVLFHSIALVYLSDEDRSRFRRLVRDAGRAADADHRLAWISFEVDKTGTAWLICERWPERDRVRLAGGNPHGADVRWQPEVLPPSGRSG